MTAGHDPPPPARAAGAGHASGLARVAPFDPGAFEEAVRALVRACGFADDNPHMKETPTRVRELWQSRLLDGHSIDPARVLGDGFADPRTDLVVVRNIALHGMCPHHLVPYTGTASVAYAPGGRLFGFGRITQLVDALAHRFSYQEWLTRDLAEVFVTAGGARGAAVQVETTQMCLRLAEERRGDERVVTQAVAGALADSPAGRAELLLAVSTR